MTPRLVHGLTVAVAAAWLSAHLVAQAPWTEIRGEGFVLRGALSNQTLAGVGCDLETAVQTLRLPTAESAVPVVVAVNGARGIRDWLPEVTGSGRGNTLGAYWRGLYGDHIVVRVDGPPNERLRRVLHEYAHFVTHRIHPEPPRWLDEGLSEVWEHVAIVGRTIETGRPVPDHVQRLRSGKAWIPVRELLTATDIPTSSDATTAMFYAESWALVHYLHFAQAGGLLVLDRLPESADIPTDAELRAYILGPMAPSTTIASTAEEQDCLGPKRLRQLTPLETALSRAQALADGERPDAALPVLRDALRLDPGNADAAEALGYVHFTGNRPADAAAVFDDAIAARRGSYISYYYRAVLAEAVPERKGGGGRISQVEYLRTAVRLNPQFTPAVERLRELTGKTCALPSGSGCETLGAR